MENYYNKVDKSKNNLNNILILNCIFDIIKINVHRCNQFMHIFLFVFFQ